MSWSLRIARVGETEIKIHFSFVLIILYVLRWHDLNNLRAALFTLFLLALLFACIVLHELGHTFVARRYGISVRSIVLWPLGGFAMLSRIPERPLHELLIAAAGPLVNLALIGLTLLGKRGMGALAPALYRWQPESLDTIAYAYTTLDYLVTANLALALFNLIPAYPLDGGRILRAGLIMAVGEKRANPLMLWLSWALAIGLGVYAVLERDWPLFIVAVLVFLAAGLLSERLKRALDHSFDRGLAAIRRGDYDAAIVYYDRAIRRNPKRAMSYNNRGAAYAQKHEHLRAIADFSRALDLQPTMVLALSNRAQSYRRTRQFDCALADTVRLEQLNPNDVNIYIWRGYIAYLAGDDVRAMADYERAAQLAPNNTNIYLSRGLIYLRAGDYAGARAEWEHALQLDPNAAPVYVNRGLAAALGGDDRSALADFERALQLAPNIAPAYQNLGMIHQRAGEYQQALDDYERAAELDPRDPEIHALRGSCYYALGDSERACECIELALKHDPEGALVYDDTSLSHYLTCWLDYDEFYYDRAAQLRPNDPLVYQGLGDAYRVKGEPERALAAYNRAIELGSERADVYLGRGRVFQQQGQHDQASADFNHVLALSAKPNTLRKAEAHLRELLAVASS